MILAEELVGITYQFFLKTERKHIAVWQRQLLRYDIVQGKACAGVSLTHQCMAKQAKVVEHLAPHDAMANVGFGACAIDAWRIDLDDAYVVQHGSFEHKIGINGSTCRNKAVTQFTCQLRHLPAMDDEHLIERRL